MSDSEPQKSTPTLQRYKSSKEETQSEPRHMLSVPESNWSKISMLRSVPRKVSDLNDQELLHFDNWISETLEDRPRSPTISRTEKESKRGWASAIDLGMLPRQEVEKFKNSLDFRRIYHGRIPKAGKPVYEQEETTQACNAVADLMDIRDKYIMRDENTLVQHPLLTSYRGHHVTPTIPELANSQLEFSVVDGIYTISLNGVSLNTGVVRVSEYYRDHMLVATQINNVVNKSFCHMRIKYLKKKFKMHLMFNNEREMLEQRSVPHRDFYNIRKIDNHVHLSASMNQKHLQRFIKNKLKNEGDTIVKITLEGPVTLSQFSETLGLKPHELSVLSLNCYADSSTYHRFDRFNSKYNPLGQPFMRELFLKTDNYMKGRFFAEIVKEVVDNLEREKYILAEYRFSIYGKNRDEWHKLAAWFYDNKLSTESVKWMVQIPRLFKVYIQNGLLSNFQDMIRNIFDPIFEATLNPNKYPMLEFILENIGGFDLVDDESILDKVTAYSNYKKITPSEWSAHENPPYSYWSYYLYANLNILNQIRRTRGLNTFAFRPHCGEAGAHDHLVTAFLTAHSINHGVVLKAIPVLQYLYYLTQIGLSISPLSNNK
jgi:AMP deaminase